VPSDKKDNMAEEVGVRRVESSSLWQNGAVGRILKRFADAAKGAWEHTGKYAAEVKMETKRVTWPGMQEVYGTTVMVVLTTFLFGIYFWLCDDLFQYSIVKRLLGYLMHRV